MIEHRHHTRIPLSRKAVIYDPHGYICPCNIDNMSADGIFIRTSNKRFRKGSIVEVAIKDSTGQKSTVRMKGLIIHEMPNGIGLMCTDTALQTYFQKSAIKERSVAAAYF